MQGKYKKKIGKYIIEKVVGRGGSGTVLKANDPMMGRDVAIKLLHSVDELRDDEMSVGSRERFLSEAKAYGRLRHENIVSCYSCDAFGDDLLLVMEYVEGDTLKAIFDQNKFVDIYKSVDIILQILDALSYAHLKGVIHRDIKPSNIMIDTDGHVKITDFGIARIDATDLTRTGMVLGSPGYMSPEQFMGRAVDLRTDVFSVAVIFYQLLTGQLPFKGRDLGEVLHKVLYEQPTLPEKLNSLCSPELSALIMKGLSKKPEQRFSTASEFSSLVKDTARAMTPAPDNSDVTLLDAIVPNNTAAIVDHWHWQSGRAVLWISAFIISIGVVTLYLNNQVIPIVTSAPPLEDELTKNRAGIGAIGGDDTMQAEALKRIALYSSIDGLLSQLSCVDSRVTLNLTENGYQVDMQGYYSVGQDLHEVIDKLAHLPGVSSVSNQMMPGIHPYCDVIDFLVTMTKGKSIIIKSGDGMATVFNEGDLFKIGMTTIAEPLYYYVNYFLMDGTVEHLNSADKRFSGLLQPNQTLYLGDESSKNQWEVAAPFGLEMVTVIATNKPLDEEYVFSENSSVHYLDNLQQALKQSEADLIWSDYVYIKTQEK